MRQAGMNAGKEMRKAARADRAAERAARYAALADIRTPACRDGPRGGLDYWIALAGVSNSARWR